MQAVDIDLNNPVFILGCTKSGTTLMRNLLSGHEAFFAIPFESHFFQNIRYWVDYDFRRTRPEKLDIAPMKAELCKWVEFSNQVDNPLADGFVKCRIKVNLIRNRLQKSQIDSIHDLYVCYLNAIYEGVTGSPCAERIRFIEKSVENAEFAGDMQAMFPGAKFVHSLRNPYANLVAMRKYISLNRYGKNSRIPFYRRALKAMKNSYYFLYRNMRLIKNYQVIRYEDLLADPEKTMAGLADFLGIPFSEKLLTPLHLGRPWGGNSTSGASFAGIDPGNIDHWKKEITAYEISLVNDHFPFVVEDFGYEALPSPRRSPWRRARGEGLRSYLANRLYFQLFRE